MNTPAIVVINNDQFREPLFLWADDFKMGDADYLYDLCDTLLPGQRRELCKIACRSRFELYDITGREEVYPSFDEWFRDANHITFANYFDSDRYIDCENPRDAMPFGVRKVTININKKKTISAEEWAKQLHEASEINRKVTEAKLASEKAETERILRLPITKIVCVIFIHGSAVGPHTDLRIPYPTDDFRRVFYYSDYDRPLYVEQDPRYVNFLGSFTRPYNPHTLKSDLPLLLGAEHQHNTCKYENGNIYLQPIVFSVERQDLTYKNAHFKNRTSDVMGIYMYIFRDSDKNPNSIYVDRKHIIKYDELHPGYWVSYSLLFDKISSYIKKHENVKQAFIKNPNILTIGFFCCRNNPFTSAYDPTERGVVANPIRLFTDATMRTRPTIEKYDGHINSQFLFVYNLPFSVTLPYLMSSMKKQLFVKEYRVDPATGNTQPTSWMFWQGCLFNLMCFFKIINRESADALAAVSTKQQIRQISSNRFVVSGESVENAILIFNNTLHTPMPVKFVKRRIEIKQGFFELLQYINTLGGVNPVIFTKMYERNNVPTEPALLSEIGHWIAIAKFTENSISIFYYIDVQQAKFYRINDISQVYSLVTPTYSFMDLIYIVPIQPAPETPVPRPPPTKSELSLLVKPSTTPAVSLLSTDQQIQLLAPENPNYEGLRADTFTARLRRGAEKKGGKISNNMRNTIKYNSKRTHSKRTHSRNKQSKTNK